MSKSIFGGPHRLLVEILKTARKESGLTQAELAEKIGKDQSYISLVEGGQRRVDTIEFIAICRAIGRDPVELFSGLVASMPSEIDI